MTPDVSSTLDRVLALGGVGILLLVGIAILFFGYKFFQVVVPALLPIAQALKPATGNNGAGQLFTVLQELTSMGSEVKLLATEIRTFTKTIEDHVPTKAELLEQFTENRHDVRNIVQAGMGAMVNAVDEIRPRRSRPRRRSERRK